jgi:hypothetical protein
MVRRFPTWPHRKSDRLALQLRDCVQTDKQACLRVKCPVLRDTDHKMHLMAQSKSPEHR